LEYRCDILQRWKQRIAAHADAITAALSVDTGRYLLAKGEVEGTLHRIDYWCDTARKTLANVTGGHSAIMPTVEYDYQLVPYPLVGVISPWNFPLTLSLIDAIPALLAGSAIIVKPSEVTPRFAQPLEQTVQEVPELAGLLTIVTGDGATGAALIDAADAICFTGSVATGKKVAAQAAQRFIPAFLELGGKDPAIVMASADLDNATNAILRSAVGSTGQACQSLERVYVDRQVFDSFLNMLVAKAESIRLNYPDIHDGHIGPLIFAKQAETIQAQLEDAVARGATLHCGGKIESFGGGKWCLPTVVSGVTHEMQLMTEETFGPIIPVMPFDSADEAVHLANDSVYGLSAAVFSNDPEEALALAQRIQVGAVGVNDASLTAFVHDVEKNSFRLSGIGGSRMGAAGLLRFYRKKALLVQTAPAVSLDAFEESGLG
jgi:acyl-CoA reductase-like NAD-dependent aldehyde dehydrogenase